MPKLTAVSLAAIKAEATPGTEETLSATDAAFVVYNLKITPTEETNERPAIGKMGNTQAVPGPKPCDVSFELDLAGGGTGAPTSLVMQQVLPAANYANSTGAADTWNYNQTGGTGTISVAQFIDGKKVVAYGVRGNLKVSQENGKPGRFAFDGKGKYKEDADTAVLAPTFPTILPPIATATFTIASSYTPVMSKWEVDSGNVVDLRPDISDAYGFKTAIITNSKPMLVCDPELENTSTRDWRTKIDNSTEEALNIVVGSVTGNTITITAPKAQAIKAPVGDRNGQATREVTMQLNVGSTGSAVTIAFS